MGDESSRTIWDPLWEYVLDDYEYEEETLKRNKSKKKSGQRQPPEDSSGMFDFLGEESDGYESQSSRPHRSIGFRRSSSKKKYESRDEQDEGSYATQEHHSSRWRKNKRDTSGDSLWDVIQGKPPGSTVARADTKNSSGTRREQAERTRSQGGSRKKNKSKKGRRKLFSRFRSDRTIDVSSDEDEEVVLEMEKRSKSQDSDRKTSSSHPAGVGSANRKSTLTKNDASLRPEKKDDGFDPFSAFFSQFDPFGSDSESDLVTAESDNESDYTDERTVLTEERTLETVDEGSLLDDGTAESSAMNTYTEIRIKHSAQDGSLLEQETTKLRSQDSLSEEESLLDSVADLEPHTFERSGEIAGHEPIPEDEEPSVVQSPRAVESVSTTPWREERPVEHITLNCFKKDVPVAPTPPTTDPTTEKELPGDDVPVKKGLSRLICHKAKKKDDYDPYAFETSTWNTPSPGLPATRMIPDGGDGRGAIVERELEKADSLIGVPADRLIETKGPQSLYAYDHESRHHIDAMYSHFNKQPRQGIQVREHSTTPMLTDFPNDDRVIIQVEASTVSETDCIVRKGDWWGEDTVPLPNTPGVDIVGKIYDMKQQTATQHGLKQYQTVLSLVRWGGNSRFVSLSPSQIVKVPDSIDPAQAACLPETYLSAFQVLHFGQQGAIRYRENSLRGKSILILGSMANNMGKAILELALHAGAANIYATAKKKHWKSLIALGIMPLSQDPIDWIMRLEGTLDLVVASNGGLREDVTPTHFRALRDSGHLILSGHRLVGNDVPVGEWKQSQTPIMCARNKSLLKTMSRTHSYDVFEQWEKDLNTCKRDLVHLVQLLERGILKPNVLDRLPLTKVGKAQELLESKRLSGFLVCEPWLKTKKRAVYL